MWILWGAIGLAISLGLGAWLTPKFLKWIRKEIKEKAKVGDYEYRKFMGDEYFPSWVTGTIERLVFTILVAFDVSGTATAMAVWITIKMTTDWLDLLKDGKESWKRQLVFASLLASIVSLFFALAGGLFCRYSLKMIKLFPNGF